MCRCYCSLRGDPRLESSTGSVYSEITSDSGTATTCYSCTTGRAASRGRPSLASMESPATAWRRNTNTSRYKTLSMQQKCH